MASGHVKVPHQQAEHMAAPTSTASTSNKSLANREPSTHECFDMAFLALNIWGFDHSGLKYFEISLLFSANVVASFSIARYCFKILLNRTVPG